MGEGHGLAGGCAAELLPAGQGLGTGGVGIPRGAAGTLLLRLAGKRLGWRMGARRAATHGTSSAHHACPSHPQVCNRVTGLLSPDPDSHVLSGALVYGSGRCDAFKDERGADSNRVGIENNAGLAAALAGVARVGWPWPAGRLAGWAGGLAGRGPRQGRPAGTCTLAASLPGSPFLRCAPCCRPSAAGPRPVGGVPAGLRHLPLLSHLWHLPLRLVPRPQLAPQALAEQFPCFLAQHFWRASSLALPEAHCDTLI